MFTQNWKLALISIIMIPLASISARTLGKRVGKVTTEASILREGKNFAFTQCELIQNDITVSTGTQQMSLYHNDVAQDSSWFTPKPYIVIG